MTSNSRNEIQVKQVRQIRPSRRSLTGLYAFRGESSVAFESSLERDFLIRTEFQLSVLDVIPQPVEIPFVGATGQTYTYVPDFLVYYRLGVQRYERAPRPLLVEVKPEKEWRSHWREWSAKWKAASRFAQDQGWAFHIHDESRIRDQVLDNIRFLERYKRMSFAPEVSASLVQTVAQMGTVPIHFLLARHFMGLYRTPGLAHLWHLLATRRLDCDVTRALDETTELWVAAHG